MRNVDSGMAYLAATMRCVATIFMAGALLAGCAKEPQPPSLHQAENLGNTGVEAREQSIPVVLVVTEADCPYCMKLKREVINPVLLSGDYRQRAIFRELRMRPEYLLHDFNREPVQSDALARRYSVSVVPTVLFLRPDGSEQAKRLIGINNVEMYGYYLDQAIEAATAAIARN